MDAYFSYWSNGYIPALEKKIIKMQELSALLASKNFKNIYLITDEISLPHLKDIFDWSGIDTRLSYLDKELSSVWSLGKLKTYQIASQKKNSFIHIDYDVFLWNKLPDYIFESPVFAQSREPTNSYEFEKLYDNCPNLDFLNNKKHYSVAPNMGIFGGSDLDFINEYSSKALNIISNNYDFWKNFKFRHSFSKAVLTEQFILQAFSDYKDVDIKYLFDVFPVPDIIAANFGYTHLQGYKNKITAEILDKYIKSTKEFLLKKFKDV